MAIPIMPLRLATAPAPSPSESCRRRNAAFSLIEVLMVLLILGVLIGLILGLARHAKETTARAHALADLGELHHALTRYFAAFETYPAPPTAAPVAITDIWDTQEPWTEDPNTRSRLVDFLPKDFEAKDPWEHPYLYQHDATNAPLAYRLFSLGPNTNDANAYIFFQP